MRVRGREHFRLRRVHKWKFSSEKIIEQESLWVRKSFCSGSFATEMRDASSRLWKVFNYGSFCDGREMQICGWRSLWRWRTLREKFVSDARCEFTTEKFAADKSFRVKIGDDESFVSEKVFQLWKFACEDSRRQKSFRVKVFQLCKFPSVKVYWSEDFSIVAKFSAEKVFGGEKVVLRGSFGWQSLLVDKVSEWKFVMVKSSWVWKISIAEVFCDGENFTSEKFVTDARREFFNCGSSWARNIGERREKLVFGWRKFGCEKFVR